MVNGNATNFSLQISKFQVTAGLALLVEAKVVNGNATALTLLESELHFSKHSTFLQRKHFSKSQHVSCNGNYFIIS